VTILPVLSSHKVIKALSRAGFTIKRQSGSHIHMWHDARRILVTVPNHDELAPGTLISIIKQSKIDRDEFLSYLE
jgi:predicted RNA binding protein YcfA (HicA-like mRNA interferase family)